MLLFFVLSSRRSFSPTINDVANDIEIIAIDPNQEYSSDDDDAEEDYMSVFEEDDDDDDGELPSSSSSFITIENVKAALQASGHSRIARQSLSVPHSPTRYSMDFTGISFDDLDIHTHFPELMMSHNVRPLGGIVDSADAVKTFDLASYITQDDNFEVISPSKVHMRPLIVNNTSSIEVTPTKSLPHNNAELPATTTSRKRRACVLSSKRMHYQVPSDDDEDNDADDDVESNEEEQKNASSTDNAAFLNNNTEEIERTDNTKVDPTWMPHEQKKTSKKVKEPKVKKVKSAPVVLKTSSKTTPALVKVSSQQKNLLKVCKSTTSRMLNASGKLPKEKIHKIVRKIIFFLF